MSSAAPLSQFLASMKQVYGPLPSSSSSGTPWRPPEKSGGHRGRYLWTDAFGVVNFLTLYRETGEERYLDCARSLVTTVHDALGRTRDGRSRLPRATEAEPLAGGLRIGKTEEHGRDGDGQYHHYLTLWMFALNRMTLATGDPTFNNSAISLARAIHPNFFVNRDTSSPRMVWKISMDMSRVLVHSEGNLDPIDGYVVFKTLAAASGKADTLKDEIEDYAKVMQRKGEHFASEDMLDLGMSSWTSHWLRGKEEWATVLAKRCTRQLKEMFQSGYNDMPARYRLAFREYGACLGIQCLEPDEYLLRKKDEVVAFWEKYRETHDDLRPITEVMRVAALIPGAFRSGYFGKEPGI
ncbi:hypothetical protein EHS25_002601 [Saitozyma podzolica]|uniref:Uncharacterized protein n=1 Tax=Saitozyma podzolica TaxID=1890683 RepID=A0A427YCP0_9TREE|nr:hypothetical protein EHS25_002601 [Saitozyma podzolica]